MERIKEITTPQFQLGDKVYVAKFANSLTVVRIWPQHFGFNYELLTRRNEVITEAQYSIFSSNLDPKLLASKIELLEARIEEVSKKRRFWKLLIKQIKRKT